MVTFGVLRMEKSVVGPPEDWFRGSISSLKAGMNSDLIQAYKITKMARQMKVQWLLTASFSTKPRRWQ